MGLMTLSYSLGYSSTLFYLENAGQKCLAKTLELPQKSEKSILTISGPCPLNVIWDTENSVFYYSMEDGQVASHSYAKSPDIIKKLGAIPGESFELWLDNKTGKLMAATMMDVKDQNVTKVVKKDKTIYTYLFEGKKYVTDDLNPWGMPKMALLLELRDNKWKRLEIKPTNSEAGDTLGLAALQSYVNKQVSGIDMNKLLNVSVCNQDEDCSTESPIAKKVLGKQADGFGQLKTKFATVFYFPLLEGDTIHPSSPVIFCKDKCEKPLKFKEIKETQISLVLDDEYVMIGTEYTNGNPYIYNAKTGALILNLPKAEYAVWLSEIKE